MSLEMEPNAQFRKLNFARALKEQAKVDSRTL